MENKLKKYLQLFLNELITKKFEVSKNALNRQYIKI